VKLFPLVPGVILPTPAPARTRARIPPDYGVQEQCLPFTAASALGFLIGSPLSFGLCPPEQVPAGCHAFRSPLDTGDRDGAFADERLFYVRDDPACGFSGNAFTLDEIPIRGRGGSATLRPVQAGLSFFDREDQAELFKLHLPYIWHTPPDVDCLFLPPLNRELGGLTVLAGLVETDWYAHPVNLVLRAPPPGGSVHVSAGDPVAQAVFVSRSHRRPALETLPPHARAARDLKAALAEWYRQHARDRSAYKRLARSRQGRDALGKSASD